MAYAAVLSLMKMFQQIMDLLRGKHLIESLHEKVLSNEQQIESLQEKFSFLRDFLEEFSDEKYRDLEIKIKIRDTAYNTEDMIESYLCDQLHPESDEKNKERGYQIFYQDLEKAIEETRLIQEEATEIRRNILELNDVQQRNILPVDISRLSFSGKDTAMVGFEGELLELKEWLASSSAKLEVISIVGMGGIGKTTLARKVFNDSFIVDAFHIRCWVTVSQEYQVREILTALLLQSTGKFNSEERDDILADHLYKSLKGRKYLILMDDLWDTKGWDDVKRLFPDDNNGSRIILTTRLTDVGDHEATRNHVLNLDLLSSDKSWNLLCKRVFGEESCPDSLVGIGQKIAKDCQGLPLSIVVIGGLLSVDKSSGYWETIARSVKSFLAKDGKQCSEILYLSYNHLPAHLKPCFLYFAAFREDYDIRKSMLIKLWVAEGFLKPLNSYSLEDTAERYLEDLVKRNLIMVSGLGYGGKVKAYKVHDLLRDLCITEVQKTKFLHVINNNELPELRGDQRRVSLQKCWFPKSDHEYFSRGPAFTTRSLHYHNYEKLDPLIDVVFKFMRLLRVLDMATLNFLDFPNEVVKLKHLRYLSFSCGMVDVPELISSIWGLQTLIVNTRITLLAPHFLPRTIWKMTSLRYLRIGNCCLRNLPSPLCESKDFVGLTNLQTLKAIADFRFTDEIVKRLPNLKKLRVYYRVSKYWYYYHLSNIVCLHRLESLQIISARKIDFPENFKFPSSLKKLKLSGCQIPWDDLTMVGSLPKLEVLTLRDDACEGGVWGPNDGDFLELKFLDLYSLDLVHWGANASHFPKLKCLKISWCSHLEEIPMEIGNIATLEMIELENISSSTRESAELILEEQREFGNYGLQVHFKKNGVKDQRFC